MPLVPGSKLESYEVLGLLGAGGMGEVYRAFDTVLKRDVAIKVLASFVMADQITMPNAEGYFWPSWSPDGKYLVAIAENPSRMVMYSAETNTWKDLHTFDALWSYWTWAPDSKSLFMSHITGKDGIYQLTVPEGSWTKLTGLEGVNDPSGFDSFLSLTPQGQPAIMSRTGVAQLYLLHWNH